MLQNLVRGVAVTRVAPASRRAAVGVSFVSSESSKEQKMEEDDKEQQQQQQQKDLAKEHHHGDMMTHAFGVGYSTRSDEEGFGGIYGGNQVSGNPSSQDADRLDFDKSQGSEVKEKEKDRNQPH